ncbi:MAG TPA: RNA-binding protein [Coriobacteriia bacterium]|nr:RNA-binding protein [Coriobacteriia bacterium]
MKTLLVDGYNVLRSSGYYSHVTERAPDHTDDAFNAGRDALIADVATFAGREYEATIVFDGAGNPGSTGEPEKVAGIQVIFSPAGVSADSVIEELARKASEKGREILVITSDAATQWTVLGGKVTRMSAAGFANEMQIVQREVQEVSEQQVKKRTLGDRLSPDVRAAMEKMLRKK